MATKASTKDVSDNTEEANDAPLAGSGNLADAVKKILKKGKERGYVTLDELNAVMPPERISSEMIEDVMAQLNDMGINVVENDEAEEGEAQAGESEAAATEDYGRTDDPVRLYLREMGAVELLSREGEIAIAKRIEAGREMMIGGICESPLTIQAILDWNEALKEGRLLLRDIIDLEATQETPGDAADGMPSAGSGDMDDEEGEGNAATDEATEKDGDGEGEGGDISGFEDEDNISLAAIEEKLKPQVIETFDKIATTYSKLGKLQHQRLQAIEKGEELPQKEREKAEAKIEGYKTDLVDLVRTIRFNNARLEQLVQQLYTLNRRLMGFEGRMLRLALDVQLPREDFLERYYGHELDPNWFDHVLQLPPERIPEPKMPTVPRAARLSPREAAKQEAARKAAAEKAAKAEAAAAAKAQKEADKAAKAAEKVAAKENARLAKEAEAEAKKARLEAEREKAAKLRAKAQEAKQRELEKKQAAAEKAAAKKAADKAKADAKKQAEADKKAREKAKLQAAREREQAKKQAARDKLIRAREAAAAKKAGPAKKKAPAKPVKKAAKPTPKKPVAKKPVKKAPAKPVKKAAKPAAKKTAVKQVKKAAPARKPVKKAPAKKPAAKGKKR